jgi:hypothetical protein
MMPAIKPVKRLSDGDMGGVIATLLETTTSPEPDRRQYIKNVLLSFADGVAQRAANPATLEPDPEDGYFSETDRAIGHWAKAAARQLDEILDASLS